MIKEHRATTRRIYLFAALLLIAACLLVGVLSSGKSIHVESAKKRLQAVPLYPGATRLRFDDTDTPGSSITHQHPRCSIECARVTYDVPEIAQVVLGFYQSKAAVEGWQPSDDLFPPSGRSYYFGAREFRGWQPFGPTFPWITARYETRRDYLLDINADEKIRGITTVELIVHRLVTMPSDTPIPTLPPAPPTAPISIPPASVRTQQPLLIPATMLPSP